ISARLFANSNAPTRRPFFLRTLFGAFAILWLILVPIREIRAKMVARDAISNGSCEMVSGIVENFTPETRQNLKESFTVAGVSFRYSSHIDTPGFHMPMAQGGPIHAGVKVR